MPVLPGCTFFPEPGPSARFHRRGETREMDRFGVVAVSVVAVLAMAVGTVPVGAMPTGDVEEPVGPSSSLTTSTSVPVPNSSAPAASGGTDNSGARAQAGTAEAPGTLGTPDGRSGTPGQQICSGGTLAGSLPSSNGEHGDYFFVWLLPGETFSGTLTYKSPGSGHGNVIIWPGSGIYLLDKGVLYHHEWSHKNTSTQPQAYEFSVRVQHGGLDYLGSVSVDGPGDPAHPCVSPVDVGMRVGGGGPASPCLPCVVHSVASGVAGAVDRVVSWRGDPVDVTRGAFVDSVTDLAVEPPWV